MLERFGYGAAVVTGAASGIGIGLADALGAAGLGVVLADVDGVGAEVQATRLRASDVDAIAVQCDVSSLASVQALKETVNRFRPHVSVLCNNAGVGLFKRGIYATIEDWTWVLGVNLNGVVHGLVVFLPHMLASGRPAHIVNTSSMNGFLPSSQSAIYATAKYGIVGMTETLDRELDGTAVGVTLLAPGAVATRIFDSERNRPAELRSDTPAPDHLPSSTYAYSNLLEPSDVGALVVTAIEDRQLYVFTDPAVEQFMNERHAMRTKAFRAG
jgi:NAD(P)-dependent dehydrogenase (short-subunit alcohol dehydrogenase family)